jgi:hypothetical protein
MRKDPNLHQAYPLIAILDTYHYHASVVFGLSIKTREAFPLVVGCSLRTRSGRIIDLPARRLLKPGPALWAIDAPAECATEGRHSYGTDWSGDAIFALWRDSNFRERIADTGWIPWSAQGLIGSSTTGLAMQDEAIRAKYGRDLDKAWGSLD